MDLLECVYKLRPGVTWENDQVNSYSLETIEKTYEHNDPIPTLQECEVIWVEMAQQAFIKECESAVQGMLDDNAVSLGYDSVMTCVSYADESSVEKFQLDGIAMRKWRSGCWAKCYEILATATELPTVDEVLSQMPEFGV